MIRLLRFILTGDWHLHHWETVHEGSRVHNGRPYGRYYDCRCTVCGAVREFRT